MPGAIRRSYEQMRTLLILRHGKAAPEESGTDRDRPLTASGKRAAERVGLTLLAEHLVPDCVVSSNAERARDTARRVATAAHFGSTIHELDELYLAEPEAYITALQRFAVGAERALVVGHNPGLEALALLLTTEPVSLPTAGLVVCSLPIASFADVSLQVRGKMARFVRPLE